MGAGLMLIRFMQLFVQDLKSFFSANKTIFHPKEEAPKL
jgi:C4-dicarboxylate transporter DctQ subunit